MTEIVPSLAAHIIREFLEEYAQPDIQSKGEEQLKMEPSQVKENSIINPESFDMLDKPKRQSDLISTASGELAHVSNCSVSLQTKWMDIF